jgi:hypothetical protein
MIKKIFFPVLALLLYVSPVFAGDFGLLLNQTPMAEGVGDTADFVYTGTLAPWFSAPLGQNGKLYLSGGFTWKYEDTAWVLVPELYRFEASFHPADRVDLKIGRQQYGDSLGFIAQGLFDGVSANFDLGGVLGDTSLSLGAYYAGFQYKKTNRITMTASDEAAYQSKLDFNNMWGTYFAPERALFDVQWEWPDLFFETGTLILGFLGQVDVSKASEKYHTQYFTAKYNLAWRNILELNLGGAFEFIDEGASVLPAFAASFDIAYLPPSEPADKLSLGVRYSSGHHENSITAFTPVNDGTEGTILQAKFSGLMSVQADYSVRFHKTFSADIGISYFLRTDLTTFDDGYLDQNSSSYMLGRELYGEFIWSPLSDISLILGGGVFLPALGRAYRDDVNPRWQISLGTMISF